MSTAPQPAPQAKTPPEAPRREMRVISHCGLFYWWPVWACGFIMFIISMFGGHRLAVVPTGTHARQEKVALEPTEDDRKVAERLKIDARQPRRVLVYPYTANDAEDKAQNHQFDIPTLHMSANKNLGVLFIAVLLLVIVITNIPLRGLWSVIVIVMIISTSVIFALLEWWEPILRYLSFLDIRINAAGYLVISLVLFVLWLVVTVFFDRQLYIVFSAGQMRVRQEIGDAETAYDTTGMSVQKQRSDLFRHWVLGLGSGDLIVKTAGATSQEFHMPNVLFIGRKVKEIEDMLRERQVVAGGKPS